MNQLYVTSPQDIFVVIPAHNEERFIGSVVITTLAYAHHVVVVDDGSTDRTAEVARSAGADVLSLSQQKGKGQALNAGFKRMRQLNAQVVVTLDGDAQHAASDIPIVVQPILNDTADVVIGSRFLSVQSKIPWWRQVGQKALTFTTNTLSGAHVTDSQSGYRAFSARALELMMFRTAGLSVESEMQFLIDDFHLRVAEVPIHVQYLDGNKRNPMKHGVQVIDSMLAIVSHRHPLLFFAVPGVILIVSSCVLGIDALSQVSQHGFPFPMLIMTVATMVSGILLLLTGTILHSLEFVVERISHLIRGDQDTDQDPSSPLPRKDRIV